MKNITYADKIRKLLIESVNDYLKIKKVIFNKVDEDETIYEYMRDYSFICDQNIKQFIKYIISTDYFVILNYDAKRNEAFSSDISTELNNLKIFMSNHDFNILLADKDVAASVYESVKTIKNASFYKKIAILKSLTDEDIKFILSINPFFDEELRQYNIEADADFFYSEIDAQESTNIPNLEVYNELASLLIDLYMIDEDLVNSISSDMIDVLNIDGTYIETFIDMIYDGDVIGVASMLYQYYALRKEMFETNVPKK